jgi:hypothetical protein
VVFPGTVACLQQSRNNRTLELDFEPNTLIPPLVRSGEALDFEMPLAGSPFVDCPEQCSCRRRQQGRPQFTSACHHCNGSREAIAATSLTVTTLT